MLTCAYKTVPSATLHAVRPSKVIHSLLDKSRSLFLWVRLQKTQYILTRSITIYNKLGQSFHMHSKQSILLHAVRSSKIIHSLLDKSHSLFPRFRLQETQYILTRSIYYTQQTWTKFSHTVAKNWSYLLRHFMQYGRAKLFTLSLRKSHSLFPWFRLQKAQYILTTSIYTQQTWTKFLHA